MVSTVSNEIILDVRNLLCPLPVIRLQDRIKLAETGASITVICTDPGVKYDIPAWCRIHGHEVVTMNEQDREIHFVVRVN